MLSRRKILTLSIFLTFTLVFVTFCILILLKNKNFEKEYSFNISFPSEKFYEDYCGCSLEMILSFRKFTTYELTNDVSKDIILFKKIQLDVRNLIAKNDSNNGIHVKFNLKTKYQDVINILNICEIEKAPTYIVKDYDIWIMTGKNSELIKNCPYKYLKK